MDGGVGQKGGKEMGGMKFGCGFWRKGALTLLVVFFFFFFSLGVGGCLWGSSGSAIWLRIQVRRSRRDKPGENVGKLGN